MDKQFNFLGGSFSSPENFFCQQLSRSGGKESFKMRGFTLQNSFYSYCQSKVKYFSIINFTIIPIDMFTSSLLFVRDKNVISYT